MTIQKRLVRSYVRRERPFKDSQKADWDALWPVYGVMRKDWARMVQERPCILDIGFGDGEALLALAGSDPAHTYLGVEMYRTGLLKVMRSAEESGATNIRVIEADAREVLLALPAGSLAGAHMFFPDPWPKARHHKRRLVTAAFVDELVRTVTPGGVIHMATDWEDYATEAAVHFASAGALAPLDRDRNGRPVTRFERRGWQLGHASFDLRYQRGSLGR